MILSHIEICLQKAYNFLHAANYYVGSDSRLNIIPISPVRYCDLNTSQYQIFQKKEQKNLINYLLFFKKVIFFNNGINNFLKIMV